MEKLDVEVKPSYMDKVSRVLSSEKTGCTVYNFTNCEPGKLFLAVAGMSLAATASRSWQWFVNTLVYEAVIAVAVLFMCRHCINRYMWAFVILVALVPTSISIIKKDVGENPRTIFDLLF
jgi:hypothetical protein